MKLANYKIITSLLGKTRGLMFSRKKTLVFSFSPKQNVSLHTLFVFFPITVLFLDKKKIIVEQTVMKPFSFYWPRTKARYIVEIPVILAKRLGERVYFR